MNEEAGFWIRLGAWVLDALIVSLPISILFGAVHDFIAGTEVVRG